MSKRSEEIRHRRKRVADFRNGLVDLLNICEPVENYLGNDRWQPKRGYEDDAQRRATELQRITHPAAVVVQETGGMVDFKPAGTWQTRPLNPVLVWSTLFDKPLVDASLIVNSCDLVIGALDAAAEDAEAGRATTRTGSGGIGPTLAAHKGLAWAGGIIGTIIATVLGTGIAHWLGWM